MFLDDPEICRNILESLPTGLCVIDTQKKIVFWSDGAERITGHLRHEVLGRSCIAEPVLHCDQPGCEFCSEECPAARAIKTSRPSEAGGFLHHKAGYEVPVRIRAVPVHNQHGSVIGAMELFDNFEQRNHDCPEERLPGCVDEITSVANHTMMRFHLREALNTFAAGQVPFAALCFRLEGLEHFRAAFGPEACNSLLRAVARTLETALWKTDSVSRWTDDQFLVLLHGCRDDAVQSVRERLRRMLADDFIEWWGERRSLPVSIGQAVAEAADTVDSFLERAQKSLDAASAWRVRSAAAGNEDSSGS